MIAVARIIGETAPLLVTTGVVDSINPNPFDGRMQNLAVYAFNEYRTRASTKPAAFDRAWAAALTLILIVMILNLSPGSSTAATAPRSADTVDWKRHEAMSEIAPPSR